MSKHEAHKTQIANEVIEKYHSTDNDVDFAEEIQSVVELDEEGFARGLFVALQVIRNAAYNGCLTALVIAHELVESAGGIEFLEEHLEADNEIDAETVDWYKAVFC